MPTLASHIPSFQLALLKPMLEREGISVEPRSLSWTSEPPSLEAQRRARRRLPSLVGEWIWAKAAFGDPARERSRLPQEVQVELEYLAGKGGTTLKGLKQLRHEATFDFLDAALKKLEWEDFTAVGFTVVSSSSSRRSRWRNG